jgi:acyl-coenzyme A thioesterase PaaI-like protein
VSNVDSHTISESHFIGELGLTHWIDRDVSYGKADITAEMLVPGTSFVRIGVLATFADLVAGQPPSGAMNPTTDLSVHIDCPTEMSTVHLVSRVVKAGATLVVIETRLTADHQAAPFATSLATFMNRKIQVTGRPSQHSVRLGQPVAERIGASITAPGTVEIMIRGDVGNSFGTVQGGVLAVLAELAAESAVDQDAPFVITDLDARYLNRVKVGPVEAVAEVLIDRPPRRTFGVHVRDRGEDRLVTYVAASGTTSW